MFDYEAKLYRKGMASHARMVADIQADQFGHQPIAKINTPAWITGHLAIASDFGLKCLGMPPAFPADWHQQFGPGSDPAAVTITDKELLIREFIVGHERFLEHLPRANADSMAGLHGIPMEILNDIPQVGDLVAHLLTSHEWFHLGQLSTWRRIMGLAPVFSS